MKKLSRTSIAAYGAGDTANSMIISTANMFLLVYYTDVAGLGAAAAGTLLVAARMFNAFTDIAAGRIVDRVHSPRWGKFRPFLMFGFIPLVLGAAVFHVPDVDAPLKLLYAYCTYGLVCLAYSLVNVPYGCLVGAMTQDPRDRARLAGARTIGGLVTGATLGFIVAPLLGAGGDMQQIRASLRTRNTLNWWPSRLPVMSLTPLQAAFRPTPEDPIPNSGRNGGGQNMTSDCRRIN